MHTRSARLLPLLVLVLAAACGPAAPVTPPPTPSTSASSSTSSENAPPPRSAASTTQAAPAPAPAPAAEADGAPSSDAPRFGGTYQYLETAEPTIWDPHLSEARAVQDQGIIYPRLLQYKTGPGIDPNSFTVVPDLAESWEQPDPVTYVFHLHQNAKWGRDAPMNNRPITADDVVFSFNRLASDISAFRTNFEAVDHVEAVDAYTVKFTLKHPFAPFLTYVAYHGSRILPADLVQQCGDLRTVDCARKAGGGPWLLDSYQPGVAAGVRQEPGLLQRAEAIFRSNCRADHYQQLRVASGLYRAEDLFGRQHERDTGGNAQGPAPSSCSGPRRARRNMSITFNVARAPWNDLQSSPGGQHGAQPPELHRHRAAG